MPLLSLIKISEMGCEKYVMLQVDWLEEEASKLLFGANTAAIPRRGVGQGHSQTSTWATPDEKLHHLLRRPHPNKQSREHRSDLKKEHHQWWKERVQK